MAQITLNSTGVASDGALVLQSNGTTAAVTISTAQVATIAKDAVVNGLTVGRGAGAVSSNTAVGASALAANTSGTTNTAIGQLNLLSNTSGANNTSVGRATLALNTTGNFNSALGEVALYSNSTGSNNMALGYAALYSSTTATVNTAVGYQSGYSNTTGAANVFFGTNSGFSATTASYNTFIGREAGYSVTTGGFNTFVGQASGYYVTTGTKNSILGQYNGNQGGLDIRTASNYIVLSDGDGYPSFYIQGGVGSFIKTIAASAGTNAVKYNTSTFALTFDTSSARYKDNIRDSVYGLSHVMQMRSAQFEYKDTGRSDVGLIAEELDPIIPELVGKNADGQPDSVSYDRMVSVLVKAIQELKAEFDAYKEAHP